jgi:histidinol-phosphatase (PHP family)
LIGPYFAIDYQVHSLRSHDGKATIREQCRRAVEIGLDEIGFTEHKDFDPADPVVEHFDYERYAAEIGEAREEFGDRLAIRMGVELDYQRWFEDSIADYLAERAFDYVLGSVHYVDRKMLMTPEYIEGRTREESYARYFAAVRDSVESGQIDVVGHLEYANRRGVGAFGPYDWEPYQEQVAELFDRMIARGIALEINTAGLRQGVGHTYPCEAHIALYAERGGRLLTIGSDSHQPEDLAASYDAAVGLALKYGFTEVCTFQERRRNPAPLMGPAG